MEKELNEKEQEMIIGGTKNIQKWSDNQCSILNQSNCSQHSEVCQWDGKTCVAVK